MWQLSMRDAKMRKKAAVEESNPAQHQLLYCRVGIGFHLQIVMNGSVGGVHEPSEYSLLRVFAVRPGIVGIRGVKSERYLCMNQEGIAHGMENAGLLLGLHAITQGTTDQTHPQKIEVVSVTEEDIPSVDTPTLLKASPLDSSSASPSPAQDDSTIKPTKDPLTETPSAQPSLSMPVTKVQPFVAAEEKTLRGRLFARRMEILIGACIMLTLIIVLGIGLGVGLSCTGKFRCGSSGCVSMSAQCDGHFDCEHGEDELSCVRLSGKSSVLQVLIEGVWRTVCAENWDADLSLAACKQLGYLRYVESKALPLSSVEQAFQSNLVSITCGTRPKFSARIVGGNLSVEGQFPWQVSLHFQNEHLCGGSIISSRWILTAAHCVYGFAYPVLWTAYVGLIDQPVNAAQSLAVEKIVYHSRYRPKGLDHDIALMKLVQPLNFNGFVEPICLPNFGEEFEDGKICWISGWGATDDGAAFCRPDHSLKSFSVLNTAIPIPGCDILCKDALHSA
ncbi:transmembrane protease serine 3 [Labeo rohita]|uniref:Transmembrane protease serine 3 n=1 Tax=Labeo rohita TaxID=84645 RepID=A0A498LEY2_LABRO|nr:transmembrane protease serine 3 [Labeo rohita]